MLLVGMRNKDCTPRSSGVRQREINEEKDIIELE
jgi:hypothetical protein